MKKSHFLIIILCLCFAITNISCAVSKAKQASKLTNKLENSRDANDRSKAARELGKMGAWDAVPALSKALSDPDAKVRASAARALWDLKDYAQPAQNALRTALNDRSPSVKYNVVGALAAMGEDAKNLVKARKEIFRDGSLFERFYSGKRIRSVIGDVALMPTALEVVEKYDHFSDMSRDARDLISDMIKTQNRDLIPVLIAKLKDGNPRVSTFIAGEIGKFKPAATQAVPILRKMLKQGDNKMQRAAARGLNNMKIAAYQAVPDLAELLLNCSEEHLCRAAADALGYIAKAKQKGAARKLDTAAKKAVPALKTKLIKSVNDEVRIDCAEALGRIGPRAIKVLPLIVKILGNDKNPKVREAACDCLSGMGTAAKAAIPALKKAQEDKNSFVRNSAWRALLRVNPK